MAVRLYEEDLSRPLSVKSSKVLSGPFAVLDVFNNNRRRYPARVYEEAYSELEPKIKEHRLLGELDHPIDYDEVRLSNVSHLITECELKETSSGKKVIYGSVQLLDTPAGMIAQSLVEAGVPLGISSRGIGNTKSVGEGVDVTQLKLITYDLVADPSFSAAILTESKKKKLGESLNRIESQLSLNESKGDDPIRTKIIRIRESLNLNTPQVEDIRESELTTLKTLAEEYSRDCKDLRSQLEEQQSLVTSLEMALKEQIERNKRLTDNMKNLQEAYNNNVASTVPKEEAEALKESVLALEKQLAVEKRGMSYDRVSHLLENANSSEEIEKQLDSLSKLRRTRSLNESKDHSKRNSDLNTTLVPKGLAHIISKV